MPREIDRREYRRVRAPILVRPLGPLAQLAARQVSDISLGGLRTYSDEPQRPGTRLELELVFPSGGSTTCLAEVIWVEALPRGSPARYEMGFRFEQVDPEDLGRISSVLEG